MRGLKRVSLQRAHILHKSHPTWVRGLKHDEIIVEANETQSHPTWVRGLKLLFLVLLVSLALSHPTWVRGLKRPLVSERPSVPSVAPYVGAWIETYIIRYCRVIKTSHPTWVRGLKLRRWVVLLFQSRRTLRGCVD